jgi:hypothetical protein
VHAVNIFDIGNFPFVSVSDVMGAARGDNRRTAERSCRDLDREVAEKIPKFG